MRRAVLISLVSWLAVGLASAAGDGPSAAEDEQTLKAAKVGVTVRGALASVAVRGGMADAALTDALTSKDAVRRGAAAEAMCRAGAAEQMPAVRKLLKDPNASVRLRTALALAAARDKEAVP